MEAAGNVAMIAPTRIATVVAAAYVRASGSPAIGPTVNWTISIAVTRPITVSWSKTIAGATIPATSVIAASPVSVIPRPGTDKRAAYEPAWTVVAVWRAGVRIIPIVAVGADGSRTDACVNRTDANADGNLGMRSPCGKKQNPQQCSIF
jgi:hypothetical protein